MLLSVFEMLLRATEVVLILDFKAQRKPASLFLAGSGFQDLMD